MERSAVVRLGLTIVGGILLAVLLAVVTVY